MQVVGLLLLLCVSFGRNDLPTACSEGWLPLARKIALYEGFYVKGSLPARAHNPGSLVCAGQRYLQHCDSDRYAYFGSDELGFISLEADLRRKYPSVKLLKKGWRYLNGF